mgnify:CR=1 FL=1
MREPPSRDEGVASAARSELRLYGLNAVQAVFSRRPEAIRKVYLTESRIPALKPLLAWCVKQRVGYRVVEEGDLDRLAASTHHEGVVADVVKAEPVPMGDWLRALPAGQPLAAVWLDGVGNPHNFGAILRSAAHFGVAGILLPRDSTLALSGAAARVAEGGAEQVPLVRMGQADNAAAQLRNAGFSLAATVVRGGSDLFAAKLPPLRPWTRAARRRRPSRRRKTSLRRRLRPRARPQRRQPRPKPSAIAAAAPISPWRARSSRRWRSR